MRDKTEYVAEIDIYWCIEFENCQVVCLRVMDPKTPKVLSIQQNNIGKGQLSVIFIKFLINPIIYTHIYICIKFLGAPLSPHLSALTELCNLCPHALFFPPCLSTQISLPAQQILTLSSYLPKSMQERRAACDCDPVRLCISNRVFAFLIFLVTDLLSIY